MSNEQPARPGGRPSSSVDGDDGSGQVSPGLEPGQQNQSGAQTQQGGQLRAPTIGGLTQAGETQSQSGRSGQQGGPGPSGPSSPSEDADRTVRQASANGDRGRDEASR